MIQTEPAEIVVTRGIPSFCEVAFQNFLLKNKKQALMSLFIYNVIKFFLEDHSCSQTYHQCIIDFVARPRIYNVLQVWT